MPAALARLAAQPREILQSLVPFPVPVLPAAMYTTDGVDSFGVDCVPAPGDLGLADLGITPRKLEGIHLDYLRSFRAGGYDFGHTAGTQEGTA